MFVKQAQEHNKEPNCRDMLYIPMDATVQYFILKHNISRYASYFMQFRLSINQIAHTMDLLWEKFQWILPLYVKPISFQSKASVVCSVTAAIFFGFCLKKLNVFSQHIGKKTSEYLNFAEQIPRNWNVDQLSVLIASWDII